MFTQSLVVLMDRAPSLAALGVALPELQARPPAADLQNYWFCGEGALVGPSPSGDNGAVLVEVFHRPWPDTMGNPKTDVDLFAAWVMHFFGWWTFPFCLARAAGIAAQSSELNAVRTGHSAFVRCNVTYALGAGDDTPVGPSAR